MLTATEQQVKMAAQLYDMRDKARRLLGDKYKPHMSELGKILSMTAQFVATRCTCRLALT